ncbi:MAG: DEAD/DEAH box helicase [Candidatus Dormibacteraeota bacterium]|nr:DEAD/DEAH box helicase [Candidatus Dormibacteraeota bacterium]
MLVVHGIWSAGARLCLWGEDGARRPSPSGASDRHPYAAAPARLAHALELASLNGEARETSLRLLLPTRASRPLPSPEVAPAWRTGRGRTELQTWRVPALGLRPAAALALLSSLPADPPGVVIGATLRYLVEVSKLALELVAGGRLVPVLEPAGDGYVGRWRPNLGLDDDPRLRRLSAAMPAACRAEATAHYGGGRSPSGVLRDLLEELADAAARTALAAGRPPVRLHGAPRSPSPAEAWVRSLTGPDPTVRGAPTDLAGLDRELRGWRQAGEPAAGSFRLCLRLVPPEDPEVSGPAWRVEFLLQAPDDPSLLIAADEVWRADRRLVASQRILEKPQERLLGELGRASRLWPELEAALQAARPVELRLDGPGAYGFLRDGAGLLAQAGFGVLLPSWWGAPASRLGLRLRSATGAPEPAPAVPGRMGMEAVTDYRWEVALGDQALSAEELHELAELKVPLVQVRGRWIEVGPDQVRAALDFLRRQELERGEVHLADVLRAGLGLETERDGLPVVGTEAEGLIGALLAGLPERRLEPLSAPPGFAGSLRPYQERGLAWLSFLGSLGLGACLADDMGLGKTVQLLALLAAERADGGAPGPTLLVCPMSVVGNWQREAARFVPQLRVHVHHGSQRVAVEELAEAAAGCDLVITTYALAARDQEGLAAVGWHRVVLDEAQNVKNSGARQTQAVRALKSAERVALTGTPVENRLSELWSIMEFLNPGLLGPASDFRRRMAVPIERYHDESQAALLRRVTSPFVLRRLKTDGTIISDLPEKVEMKVFCNITREQATLYQAVLDDMMARIEGKEGIERRGLVLATMVKLKQVLNHPAQLLRDGSRLQGRSGKLARLEELLEEVVAEGDRALVFTQFAEMGELLRGHLLQQLGREILFLHGGTPKRSRDEMVEAFQATSGPRVFILSLKAGGTGLNLTAASHVIHFDRWWNPAVEDQATDRAFRIGQRRGVQVRKLVCVGTLEERIDRMIEDKRELAERIVGSGESWLTELSTAELREVAALSADAVAEE